MVCHVGELVAVRGGRRTSEERRAMGGQERRRKIQMREEVDDDSVTLPAWMFKALQLKEGEPICLSLDLSLLSQQDRLVSAALLSVSLFPLQRDYRSLIKRPAPVKRTVAGASSLKPEVEAGDPVQAARAAESASNAEKVDGLTELARDEAAQALQATLLECMRAYRIIKLDQILTFEKGGQSFEFQVVDLMTHGRRGGARATSFANPADLEPSPPAEYDRHYLNVSSLLEAIDLRPSTHQQSA